MPRAVEVATRFARLHQPAVRQARSQIRWPVLEQIAAQRATDDAVHAIWRSPAGQEAIGAYVARVLRRSA